MINISIIFWATKKLITVDQRQGKNKGTSFANFAPDLDLALQFLSYLPAYSQAKPCTAIDTFDKLVCLFEWFKDQVLFFFRNADTIVGNRN